MLPKRATLAAVMTAVALAFTGLSLAAPDDDLEKIMEKVNVKSNFLTKAVRTKVAYAKDQGKIGPAADDLVKLAKESRGFKEPAEKQKKAQSEWEKLTDDFIAKSQEFADLANKGGMTLDQAKKANTALKKTCSNCHEVFRVEDADDK